METINGFNGSKFDTIKPKKFTRIAKKYHKITEQSLSKMKLYKASRIGARQIKKEFGARIGSTSIATFEMLLTAIEQELKGMKTAIDFGSFKVKSYKDFSNSNTRKKA